MKEQVFRRVFCKEQYYRSDVVIGGHGNGGRDASFNC